MEDEILKLDAEILQIEWRYGVHYAPSATVNPYIDFDLSAPPPRISDTGRSNLMQDLERLQAPLATNKKRAQALQTDINRAADAISRQIYEERLAEKRDEILKLEAEIAKIEWQLGVYQSAAPSEGFPWANVDTSRQITGSVNRVVATETSVSCGPTNTVGTVVTQNLSVGSGIVRIAFAERSVSVVGGIVQMLYVPDGVQVQHRAGEIQQVRYLSHAEWVEQAKQYAQVDSDLGPISNRQPGRHLGANGMIGGG